MEAIRLHAQAHVHAGASRLAGKINRVGADDVRVALEDAHRRQARRVTVQGADAPVDRIQVARPRASRPRQPGHAQNPVAVLHLLDHRVRHGDVHPRCVQDEAVHLTRTRIASLHGEGQRQAATRRVAEDDDATKLGLRLVDDGLDDVERIGCGVPGGERVVGDDDGQPGAVDEALDDTPLALDKREQVGAAVQENESSARAQSLLRKHAGHAFVARRSETGSHTFGHGVLLRGARCHLTCGFLGVQRGRREALSGMNKTHLEGHGASFALADQQTVSVRIGTHPRANRYQDTLREGITPHCACSP